jgi:YHS domain-containing protein/uncharacterized membrane protein
MHPTPDIVLFFGRLHPLLVHLPIGLIVLLAFLEVLAFVPRFRQANANAGVILSLAVPAAAAAVLCGWLLSLGGGYDPQLLRWHKWTAIGTACACAVAALLYALRFRRVYRACLFATFLALLVASDFGGSLTHGSDYLVRYAPASLKKLFGGKPPVVAAAPKPKDIAQLTAFNDVIQPVLQKDCVSCHGPDKSKGKLRLDSLAAVLKGGGSGPALLPGKSADSEIVRRLLLPSGTDDHMPPDGKPQPTLDEITLVQWWIDSGAPADKTIAELKPPLPIKRILAARFGAPQTEAKVVLPRPLGDVLPLAAKLSDDLQIPILALSARDAWVECNASIAGRDFGDAQLARLAPLAPNMRWLDLGGTSITDTGLLQVAAMPNLTRLHLERTAITDHGLAALANLPNLQYLNLYDTAVTDAGLLQLADLPNLKEVFVWETKVTPTAAEGFIASHTDTNQLQQWRAEIAQLQAKIKGSHVSVDLGTQPAAAPMTNAVAINTVCPVSGKPVDPTKTVLYNGSLVAFCCADCKAKFEKDPTPFLAKLGLKPKDPLAAKPTTTTKTTQ